jgi:hypothetical protein
MEEPPGADRGSENHQAEDLVALVSTALFFSLCIFGNPFEMWLDAGFHPAESLPRNLERHAQLRMPVSQFTLRPGTRPQLRTMN